VFGGRGSEREKKKGRNKVEYRYGILEAKKRSTDFMPHSLSFLMSSLS